MAITVAKEFKIRPSEVIYEWESLEVLITFGVLMNAISMESWNSYKQTQDNYKPEIPEKYAIPFKTLKMIEHELKGD